MQKRHKREIAGIDTLKVRFDPSNPEPVLNIRKALLTLSWPTQSHLLQHFRNRSCENSLFSHEIRWRRDHVSMESKIHCSCNRCWCSYQGHAGLVPRRSTWTGGLKAVGKLLKRLIGCMIK